ncbi:MAG: carboxypeptidase regulatory-like domain-containing protein [Deltaproteobacteria bacterium]|nr:carboxypeptidase regulatory-like domain-containing protein [Deltaproteobacteria bacterium]
MISGSAAWAHKVNIFAYVDADTVYTESYFPDGRPVIHGTIEVKTEKGTIVLKGQTDDQGLFSFPAIKKQFLTITIKASMGHTSSFILEQSDIQQSR